jgi:hypothetical protein
MAMIFNGPFWLERMSREGSPQDHLALQEPGLKMANQLLPGITNNTQKARNYTLAAWLTTFAPDRNARRNLETAYVHAVHNHEHVESASPTGVIGINSGKSFSDTKERTLETHPNVSVLGAPFYGPSSYILGAVGRTSRGEYGPTDDPIGMRLARSIGLSASAISKGAKGHVNRRVLAELSSLCLCAPPTGSEKEALVNLLFRFTARSGIGLDERWDRPRRRTLALLLQHADAGIADREAIPDNLVAWIRGHAHNVTPHAAFEEQARGLAVLGVRSAFKLSLETVWCSLLQDACLHSARIVNPSGFLAMVIDAAIESNLMWVRPRRTLSQLIRSVQIKPFDTSELATRIYGSMEHNKPETAAAYAVDALIRIVSIVRSLPEDEYPVRRFVTEGESARVSLHRFANDAINHEDIRSWVNEVFSKYAIHQHLRTAAAKWRPGEADGFFLNAVGGGWEVAEGGESILPAASPTKIFAAMSLMKDLGLWTDDNDKTRLTVAGRDVLRRVIKIEGV